MSDQPTESAAGLGSADEALQRYQQQLSSIGRDRERLKRIDGWFGVARVALFFFAICAWLFGFFADHSWATITGWIAIVVFIGVAIANEPFREQLAELQRNRSVILRLIARLNRDWDKLSSKKLSDALAKVPLTEHQRDVADDLDLLGKTSLFHLVSITGTTVGLRTLAQWLAGNADATVANQRAEAVKALSPLREERLRFYSLSRDVGESSGDPDQFVQWATGDSWLASRQWLVTWSNLSAGLAVALIIALVLGLFGALPDGADKYCGMGLIVLTLFNFGLTGVMLGPAHQIFAIAMSNRQAVGNYQELFHTAESIPPSEEEGFLKRIRHVILHGEHAAETGMSQLRGIARAGSMRQSAALFFVYLPLQAFALWDVRVLKRLEQWQARYREDVPKWFEALGELESLMSIAALHDEYPLWAMPVWTHPSDDRVLQAHSIGHPLLPDDSRVCNDVSVGPPGTVLLVTGSNMSGKSTLLRSIGLNVSLAAIGAPVCAKQLILPSVQLATSIRVRDDVGEGVSFYMAELQRLKKVVDQARELAADRNQILLYLLDEILQGTNSRERQIAVVQVLRHLINSETIGAISTHDLELADEPELQSLAVPVHFRETIEPDAEGNEQMSFDYQMREGVSPTTNALRLLKMVGLGREE